MIVFGPEGEIRDEVAVHHVEVDPVGALPLGARHRVGEVAEVGVEDARGDPGAGRRDLVEAAASGARRGCAPSQRLDPGRHRLVAALAAERPRARRLEALPPPRDRGCGRLAGALRRELPAGGADLLAAVAPDRHRDPDGREPGGERLDHGHRAGDPRRVRDRVHRDQVDVGEVAAQQVAIASASASVSFTPPIIVTS